MGREFPGSPVVSVLRSPCGEPGFKLCVVAKKNPKNPKKQKQRRNEYSAMFLSCQKSILIVQAVSAITHSLWY